MMLIDIDEASDRKVVGVLVLSWTEILFEIGFPGYRCVRASSEEN